MDINIADVIIRTNELQDIDADTMQKAIEEVPCKTINFPFYMFYFGVIKNNENNDGVGADKAKEYALKTFSVFEEASGISYSAREKDIISECFAIARCGKEYTVAERISKIEALSSEFKDEEAGTIAWTALELLKRELLRYYSYDYSNIQKMKELIAELKPSNELYKKCIEKELM